MPCYKNGLPDQDLQYHQLFKSQCTITLSRISTAEKDILKLVTTLIANTKGEGKGGDDFWVKAETLLLLPH